MGLQDESAYMAETPIVNVKELKKDFMMKWINFVITWIENLQKESADQETYDNILISPGGFYHDTNSSWGYNWNTIFVILDKLKEPHITYLYTRTKEDELLLQSIQNVLYNIFKYGKYLNEHQIEHIIRVINFGFATGKFLHSKDINDKYINVQIEILKVLIGLFYK